LENAVLVKKYKNFKASEFDSPDVKGSGKNMKDDFMELLQEAREIAQIPFKINSGYRTQEYHEKLGERGYKTAKYSAHCEGRAADISCTNSKDRWLIVGSLLLVGFNRIGIADGFIHVDNSPTKSENRIWTY
tara:strand:+ start:12700 stop:13095 length:396 start_codon:yes stop_codon:yes gene_type:complete